MAVVGTTVGRRYRLLEQLGQGGMGVVWRAHDELLGREVAVKELTFPAGTAPEHAEVLRERTRREARAAARLAHPSAVTVFDVLEEDGRPWLVMELVEAPTLAQVVAAQGPLSPQATADVGLAVLGALRAAHRAGIVHRDVKPSNVLLAPASADRPARAVLTDFGIATSTGDPSLTSSGLLLGSPAFIAPERVRGGPPEPASDLWALGATLYTAVEGHPPYDAGDALLTLTAVATGKPAPIVRAGPLRPVLEGLLEPDPARRLSAQDAEQRLLRVARARPEAPTGATVPLPGADPAAASRTAVLDVRQVQADLARPAPLPTPRPAPLPAPPPRRRAPVRRSSRPAAVAAALALAAVAGVGAYALLHQGDGDRTPAASAARPSRSGSPAPPPSPTPTRTPSPSPRTPTPTPSASAAASSTAPAGVPAGWTVHDGPGGWRAAVPPSYAVGSSGGFPEYRDRSTGRTLRVSTGKGQPDAVADRRRQAVSFAAAHPSYREIGIRPVTYRGVAGADWEFTYEGLHVLDRVFVVDGRGYSLFFQSRAGDTGAADDLAGVLAGFAPAGRTP